MAEAASESEHPDLWIEGRRSKEGTFVSVVDFEDPQYAQVPRPRNVRALMVLTVSIPSEENLEKVQQQVIINYDGKIRISVPLTEEVAAILCQELKVMLMPRS